MGDAGFPRPCSTAWVGLVWHPPGFARDWRARPTQSPAADARQPHPPRRPAAYRRLGVACGILPWVSVSILCNDNAVDPAQPLDGGQVAASPVLRQPTRSRKFRDGGPREPRSPRLTARPKASLNGCSAQIDTQLPKACADRERQHLASASADAAVPDPARAPRRCRAAEQRRRPPADQPCEWLPSRAPTWPGKTSHATGSAAPPPVGVCGQGRYRPKSRRRS